MVTFPSCHPSLVDDEINLKLFPLLWMLWILKSVSIVAFTRVLFTFSMSECEFVYVCMYEWVYLNWVNIKNTNNVVKTPTIIIKRKKKQNSNKKSKSSQCV